MGCEGGCLGSLHRSKAAPSCAGEVGLGWERGGKEGATGSVCRVMGVWRKRMQRVVERTARGQACAVLQQVQAGAGRGCTCLHGCCAPVPCWSGPRGMACTRTPALPPDSLTPPPPPTHLRFACDLWLPCSGAPPPTWSAVAAWRRVSSSALAAAVAAAPTAAAVGRGMVGWWCATR